eukprot:c13294_g1_i1 orf=341-607(+)
MGAKQAAHGCPWGDSQPITQRLLAKFPNLPLRPLPHMGAGAQKKPPLLTRSPCRPPYVSYKAIRNIASQKALFGEVLNLDGGSAYRGS